jgi:SAM-dependent methyltransferase
MELTEHVRRNRTIWDEQHTIEFSAKARAQWSASEPRWGIWQIPQSDLPVFPADLSGLDVIDLGCGTGYVCAWAVRAGACPVGIDNSAAQLATARAMQQEFGLRFPLIHGDAERVPLRDRRFDLAISEHGAIGWCDPYRWIAEAARILRPGGELVFVRNSTLLTLCMPPDGPAGTGLLREQFDLNRMDHEYGGVNFHLPHGPMIRLLRDCGFVVEDLIEVRAPANAQPGVDYVTPDWARRWPSAEVWRARRAQ